MCGSSLCQYLTFTDYSSGDRGKDPSTGGLVRSYEALGQRNDDAASMGRAAPSFMLDGLIEASTGSCDSVCSTRSECS